MIDRHLLCIGLRYSDCSWVQGLTESGWNVEIARDLTTAHRVLQASSCLVGLLVPGKVNEDACHDLDVFLRAHGTLEWVGAFEPELLKTPRCRDLIVDHLFDHHTTPIDVTRLAMTIGHAR
jgi:hypothetical protein